MSPRFAIGVIGDVHHRFDAHDVAQLDAQGYAAILFVGDLTGFSHQAGLKVAQVIAQLKTPTFVIPGNHDATNAGQLAAETLQTESLANIFGIGHRRRVETLRQALGNALMVGYSCHRLPVAGRDVDLIAGRPHSFGGDYLSLRAYLRAEYEVDSLEASAARLCALVDASEASQLVFLAHNGPLGLGDKRDDIWGCDFRISEGDFGDPDLREAIDYARARGKEVMAVVAGHMHHAIKGGGARRWLETLDGVLYVNAARVPRIFRRGKRELRHHVRITLGMQRCDAEEILIESE